MNLSPSWADKLSSAGYLAVHWSACGKPNALDSEILLFAEQNGYVLLTHDLDFGAILAASSGSSPSVIQIRAANLNSDSIATEVIAAIKQMTTELESGALLIVEPGSNRLRMLPLNPK
jgi:predicted nuclease of predicted toxin-antitoxin system